MHDNIILGAALSVVTGLLGSGCQVPQAAPDEAFYAQQTYVLHEVSGARDLGVTYASRENPGEALARALFGELVGLLFVGEENGYGAPLVDAYGASVAANLTAAIPLQPVEPTSEPPASSSDDGMIAATGFAAGAKDSRPDRLRDAAVAAKADVAFGAYFRCSATEETIRGRLELFAYTASGDEVLNTVFMGRESYDTVPFVHTRDAQMEDAVVLYCAGPLEQAVAGATHAIANRKTLGPLDAVDAIPHPLVPRPDRNDAR